MPQISALVRMPTAGQAVKDDEQLHQQRCVAGQLDVNTHDLPQNGHLVILDHCAGKANDDGKNDACNAQPHGKYSGLLVERQILLDRIPVHCRIPPLYPDLRVKTNARKLPLQVSSQAVSDRSFCVFPHRICRYAHTAYHTAGRPVREAFAVQQHIAQQHIIAVSSLNDLNFRICSTRCT